MTNSWTDIKNTKLALIFSNPAENHPGAMQWLNEAIENNDAKVIVVDPRRTRTAAIADNYLRIRPGTDIAFINGVLKYIFDNGKENTTYLSGKTDAVFKLNPGRTDYVDGVGASGSGRSTPATVALDHTDSVLTYLKGRVATYTAETVADICGCGVKEFLEVADMIANSKPVTNPMTIMYAMGTTQHSCGSQMVRSLAVLQTVLGNIGSPGTGINAMRGIHNVQGSTDMGVLFDGIPGYSGPPKSAQAYDNYMDRLFGAPKSSTFNGYGKIGKDGDYWRGWQQVGYRTMMHHFFNQATAAADTNMYFGEYNAGTSNYDHDLMPKSNGDHHRDMFANAKAGTITAMFIMGQNPAVTEANCDDVRDGLKNLDLLVVTDIFKTETAAAARKNNSRTWLLPAASFVERPGSVTNSARWIQWRNQVVPPKGSCKSDGEILMMLAKALDAPAVNAFSHIKTATFDATHGAGTSVYDVLYSDAAKSGYGWDGIGAFDANPVYANIHKQMCGWLNQGSGGTVWIYGAAYNPSGGKYGSVSTAVSANSVTINTGVGDTTVADYAAGTIVEVGNLSNLELMTVQSYAGGVVTFTSNFAKTHAAGEPVTPRGYYTYHAFADKIIAKSRGTFDPFGTGVYPKWGFSWLVNRRNFYNYNKCNTDAPHRETKFQTQLSAKALVADTTVTLSSVVGLGVGEQIRINPSASDTGGIVKTINVINTSTKVVTLDSALGSDVAAWSYVQEVAANRANTTVSGGASSTTINVAASQAGKLFAGDFIVISNADGSDKRTRKVASNVAGTAITITNSLGTGVSYSDGSLVYELEGTNTGGGSRWTPDYVTWCADLCPYRPAPGGDGTCPSPGDARDFFVAPDNKAQLFVHLSADAKPDPEPSNDPATTSVYRYRAYKTLAEADGRTPKHWEPWETAREDLAADYGKVGDAPIDTVGTIAAYPLTMTTYRNTEHFQGGPLTRNVPWLNELVPNPVLEINSYDAVKSYPKCDANGNPTVGFTTTISSGDKVWLSTARAENVGPFIAAVGTGLNANQRVNKGVIAIPWHWGEVGLNNSTAVANRLTIDSMDANTKMPETKVCLCKISRVHNVT